MKSNILEQARSRAKEFEGEEMQELLARLIHTEYKLTSTLNTMKNYLLFFVVLTVLALALSLAVLSGVKF